MPKQSNIAPDRTRNIPTRWLALALVALVALIAALPPAFDHTSARADSLFDYFWSKDNLSTVTDGITKRYPDISHITTDQLAAELTQENQHNDIVLIDVREPPEYQVSHLQGAVRATPGIALAHLRPNLPPDLKGKSLVFYCSVGERSSRMAQRMKDALMSQGAANVSNLSGGIFAWHNERRTLINAGGPTEFVHPFDSHWGRLVDRQKLTRMSLEPSPEQQTTP